MTSVPYIERTGGSTGDYLFTHIVTDNPSVIPRFPHDFVSKACTGRLRFIHVTDTRNYRSIKAQGLVYKPSDWVGDLGHGIYVIEYGDVEALDNLKDYVAETLECDELLVVEGVYGGDYTKCIKGDGHVGYIVLKNNVPSTYLKLHIISMNTFLEWG